MEQNNSKGTKESNFSNRTTTNYEAPVHNVWQTTELIYYLTQRGLAGPFITKDMIPSKIEVEEEEIQRLDTQLQEMQSALLKATDQRPDQMNVHMIKYAQKVEAKIKTLDAQRTAQAKRKATYDNPPTKRRKTTDMASTF